MGRVLGPNEIYRLQPQDEFALASLIKEFNEFLQNKVPGIRGLPIEDFVLEVGAYKEIVLYEFEKEVLKSGWKLEKSSTKNSIIYKIQEKNKMLFD